VLMLLRESFAMLGKKHRKWEEGDDISVLEFTTTEYGRSTRVMASAETKNKIMEIGISKCARESGFDRRLLNCLTRSRVISRSRLTSSSVAKAPFHNP